MTLSWQSVRFDDWEQYYTPTHKWVFAAQIMHCFIQNFHWSTEDWQQTNNATNTKYLAPILNEIGLRKCFCTSCSRKKKCFPPFLSISVPNKLYGKRPYHFHWYFKALQINICHLEHSRMFVLDFCRIIYF